MIMMNIFSLPPASAGFLLGPEDGGDILLRKIGLYPSCKTLQPRKRYSLYEFLISTTCATYHGHLTSDDTYV
jgi:hypothetical protein